MQVEKAWPGEGKQEEVGSKGGGRVEKRKEEVEVGEKEGRRKGEEERRRGRVRGRGQEEEKGNEKI